MPRKNEQAGPFVPQLPTWRRAAAARLALKQHAVSLPARLLLVHLCFYANDELECWPSQATLAAEADLSARQVRRLIDELQLAGLISISKPWKINRYRLNFIESGVVSNHVDNSQAFADCSRRSADKYGR